MLEQVAEQVTRGQKDSLKVQALTQRIAQLVAQYEEQLAELRADATVQISMLTQTTQTLQKELDATRITDEPLVEED